MVSAPSRPFPAWLTLCGAALMAAMTGGCSDEGSGPVTVSVIGSPADFATPLENLPDPGSKLFLETTAQGLVAFDAGGEILPALAQRWIVEDDGRSYIFRLRRAFWPDGSKVLAKDVGRLLTARIEALRRLDPAGPLDAVQDVVAMTGEVIEIRLAAPRPYVLQMLAQPQMAILSREGGTGPYRREKRGGVPGKALVLTPVERATNESGDELPVPAWQTRIVRAERAALAITRFQQGKAALVLGGRFSDLPLLVPAGVDRDDVRIDPVQGLLGLAVTGRSGASGKLLEDDGVRRAINMAIDRSRLPVMFPVGGWATTEQIVPGQLDLPAPPAVPDWSRLSQDERWAQGQAVMKRWRSEHGDPPALRVALPRGPGSTLLFGLVRHDLGMIGLAVERVDMAADADLRLVDEVAAYDSALWYLGRIGCARKVHCSAEAEAQLQAASLSASLDERMARVAQAEALMQAHNGFIALGAPVRWSLVARRLTGFMASPRARHPLNHLFRSTN
ncbi:MULTISPECIES: ABC transporter substrate-binding protein [Sphingobium]|uniref:Solute-binding protein family 5 domain-containing protein n=1 Tax=Sphingobium fuliginis (strain ATCC 27551) TaxID=336203 RepID=A0ABQ1EMW3_SPHSA|nr:MULTISPECIES: ABC transporter substrate-binding protein [unclassified Sphingobium]AJR22598.1 ABC transporter substrate-binding protein [Sphingobium sp. YBL2]OAP30170.1 ABC transporter substrate-binding protein [Sphingobium sp. 20006FA]RYM00967.1 ABC transporter substrate-binding protein [Sphingobium fuliginis]KXU30613.1 ABC transporter substrate-binding protein [Sphingobium sp. AM]KYC30448.1 ABC transporter substrate-binding protein [Sphingobium sp. 22B]